MKLNTKIAVTVGGLIIASLIVGTLLTDGLACRPTRSPLWLGFTCDAWLQSGAQLFGGLATLLAVVWTIDHGRSQDNRLGRTRLVAVAQEMRVIAKTFLAIHAEMEINKATMAVANELGHADIRQRAKLAIDIQPRLSLPTYVACCADLGRLTPFAAATVVEAAGVVDSWNAFLSGTSLAMSTDLRTDVVGIFEQVQAFAHVASRQCVDAATAIDKGLGP